MNPTRSTWGATSLSSSSHFPLIAGESQLANPVRLPLGRASLLTKPDTDRIADKYENNWYGADFRLNNRRDKIGVGDQHVRCKAHQVHEQRRVPCRHPPQKSEHRCGYCALPPNPASAVPAAAPRPELVPQDRSRHTPSPHRYAASRSDCCARAASGHAAAPPRSVMNSRRCMCPRQYALCND